MTPCPHRLAPLFRRPTDAGACVTLVLRQCQDWTVCELCGRIGRVGATGRHTWVAVQGLAARLRAEAAQWNERT